MSQSWHSCNQVNSLTLGRCSCNRKLLIFKIISTKECLELFLWNCPHMNATRPHWWLVSISLDNGLVPSGTKPLPEPVLTKIFNAIRHQVMACCLMAPSYYLNQCWLITNEMRSSGIHFTGILTWLNMQDITRHIFFIFTHLQSQPNLPGDNELTGLRLV